MNRRIHRFIDLVILSIGILALATALTGCGKTDTVRDAKTDRTTVTKETKVRQGVEGGQPVDVKETVYREEVSKEVAHSEQSRTTTIPAIESLGGLLGGMSTGNPILDVLVGVVSAMLTAKGAAKVADRVTKKKETK